MEMRTDKVKVFQVCIIILIFTRSPVNGSLHCALIFRCLLLIEQTVGFY